MKSRKIDWPGLTLIILLGLLGSLIIAGCAAANPPENNRQNQTGSHKGSEGNTQANADAKNSNTNPNQSSNRNGGGNRGGAIPVQVVIARFDTLTTDRQTAGSVLPVSQSQVAALTSGVVARVLHLVGDWVNTGDAIVELDDSQLRIALRNAEAALANTKINLAIGMDSASQANPKLTLQMASAQSALDAAQKNYAAQKAQYDLGGVSDSQLDNAKSQLALAQANLEGARSALDQNKKADTQNLAQLRLTVDQADNQLQLAQLNLQNAKIKAPFTGQLAAINVTKGMFVGQNTVVFLLVSAERQINFNVPPTEVVAFSLGSNVNFNYAGKSYPVRIKQAPSAPINGLVPLAASLPVSFNPPFGVVGTVSYAVTLAKGTVIPMAAIQSQEDKNYVFTVEANKAVIKNVIILGETGIEAAVAGIENGVTVIINPPPGLIQGAQVQPIGSTNSQDTADTGKTNTGKSDSATVDSANKQTDNPHKLNGTGRKGKNENNP